MRVLSVFALLLCALASALAAAPSFPDLPLPKDRGGLDSIPTDPAPESECFVTATILRGTAQLQTSDGGCGAGIVTRALSSGAAFGPRSTVTTEAGSLVELLLPDGSMVRIGPDSELRIERIYCKAGDPPTELQLATGSIWSRSGSVTEGGTTARVEGEKVFVDVQNATFVMEVFELDTIFHRRIIDMYPPEYMNMLEGIDTNMFVDLGFQGTVTRVAVFQGGVELSDRSGRKKIAIPAGHQILEGTEPIPARVEPIVPRRGFNAIGDFGK